MGTPSLKMEGAKEHEPSGSSLEKRSQSKTRNLIFSRSLVKCSTVLKFHTGSSVFLMIGVLAPARSPGVFSITTYGSLKPLRSLASRPRASTISTSMIISCAPIIFVCVSFLSVVHNHNGKKETEGKDSRKTQTLVFNAMTSMKQLFLVA